MTTDTRFAVNWDLDALMPHPETDEFRAVLDTYRDQLGRLADRSDRLPAVDPAGVSIWVEVLIEYESLVRQANDLESFVGCHAAADAANKQFQRFEAELSALEPLRKQVASNMEFALRDATDKNFQQFVAAHDWLQQNVFFLEECRKDARFRLPRDQERLSAEMAVDGIHAWGRLYDRISGALRVQTMQRGEIVEKSPGQVHFDSNERSVRENNFYAADRAWSSIADTCGDALNHIAGTRLTLYQRLDVRDHLDLPLRKNRMQRKTLDTMWSAICEHKKVLLDYLAKKAELLGLERLSWFDLQAPLPVGGRGPHSARLHYDAACDMVIATFRGFSPDLGEFALEALNRGWVEVEDREGKRQGGFCTGFPTKQESRIFMTFTNSADSMSTLAHELGHAYHSHVLRDQPQLLQDYPMNLAETASTFAEAVLGEQRLKSAESQDEQLVILDQMLGDAVAYLMNIHARFLFEDNFHRERIAGELSTERLSQIMLAAQREAYLDALDDDAWNPNFWVSKLHFYISELPFYNFPYTFGYLLSLGAYALATEAPDDFPEKYRQLLIATGCQGTEDAVRTTLGYDLTEAEFWGRCLQIVAQRVERFLELAG